MSKLNLIALIVISAMSTGYRRAGFVLEQGKNHLTDVNEEQYHLLNDDPNLTVSVDEQDGYLDAPIAQDKLIKTHEDDIDSLSGITDGKTVVSEIDVSSAPEALHPFIAVIDDLSKEAALTKKPNCDHLAITVDGAELKPTGEQRDAAWAWYQENIKVIDVE